MVVDKCYQAAVHMA